MSRLIPMVGVNEVQDVIDILVTNDDNRYAFEDELNEDVADLFVESIISGDYEPLSHFTVSGRMYRKMWKNEKAGIMGFYKPLVDSGSLIDSIESCMIDGAEFHNRNRFGSTTIDISIDKSGNIVTFLGDSGFPLTEFAVSGNSSLNIPARDFITPVMEGAELKDAVVEIGSTIILNYLLSR